MLQVQREFAIAKEPKKSGTSRSGDFPRLEETKPRNLDGKTFAGEECQPGTVQSASLNVKCSGIHVCKRIKKM